MNVGLSQVEEKIIIIIHSLLLTWVFLRFTFSPTKQSCTEVQLLSGNFHGNKYQRKGEKNGKEFD